MGDESSDLLEGEVPGRSFSQKQERVQKLIENSSNVQLVDTSETEYRSLSDTEIWYEGANQWGSTLDLEVMEGSEGMQACKNER